jgi:aryl-alcohol dehydrogenase-like predicted oxidoreductase
MSSVDRLELRPGYEISRLIKGGWQLAGDHGSVEKQRAIADMQSFYDSGITTFDCADIYTGVEAMLGDFRRTLLDKTGSGHKLRVHTKYVPDINSLGSLDIKQITGGIDRSLRRLQCECLDLVQFHWWDYQVPGCIDAMMHLQTLKQQGKIHHIGVTNFDADHLQQLCGIADIVSAQIQYSLLDRRAAGEFATIAKSHNVHLLTYGVLAGGFLTDQWLGKADPGFDFSNRSLVKYRLVIEEFGGWSLFQQLLQTLRGIADKHQVDIDTIAIRAMLDNTDVGAVIVGARYADRLPKTLRVLNVNLDIEDRTAISAIQAQSAGPHGPVFGLERDTSGSHGRIMKYNINSGNQNQLRDESDGGAA